MNTILWLIQILLAILFTLFGLMLLTTPREKILEKVTWAKNLSSRTTKLIGLADTLTNLRFTGIYVRLEFEGQ